MKDKIALRKTEERCSVSVPGLPGRWSPGEAIQNIQDAIQEYLIARADLKR
jgi:predicted RNase H-like HicB family nuclease